MLYCLLHRDHERPALCGHLLQRNLETSQSNENFLCLLKGKAIPNHQSACSEGWFAKLRRIWHKGVPIVQICSLPERIVSREKRPTIRIELVAKDEVVPMPIVSSSRVN